MLKSIVLRRLMTDRPVVVSVDPALAKPEGDALALESFEACWQRYLDTYDIGQLPLRAGCVPVTFMVGPLASARQVAHVDNSFLSMRLGEYELEMIAYAVHDIRNLFDDKGRPVEVKREETPLGLRLPEDVMMIFADDTVRREVFAHARKANQLPPEVRKSDPG